MACRTVTIRYFGAMRHLLLLLAIALVLNSRAQWTKGDSARVVELSERCFKMADEDPPRALAHGREALALATRIGMRGGQAQARGYIAYAYMRNSRFDSAQVEYHRAMSIYLELGDSCNYTGPLFNLGLNHQMLQQNDSALACFMRVLKIEEHCSAQQERPTRLFAIGSVYDGMRRYADALPYYTEALALDSAAGDTAAVIREHIAVANMSGALEDYARTAYHYQQAADLSRIRGDRYMEGYIHYNLGELAQRKGDLPTAIEEARLSVDLFTLLDRKAELAHASILLGSLLALNGDGDGAEQHLLAAYRIADSLGLRDDRASAMYQLALADEAKGDARGAMAWMKRYVSYDDSLKDQERESRMAELTTRFETEKKEKELLASQARESEARGLADRLKAQRVAYIGGAIVLLALLLLFVSRYRLKRKAAEELERVNAEVVRQKDRAEQSERAKDRFLANVSHEIRTPLNAIMGFTGLLMHEHRDERTARYLSNIREAGDNLLVVINDVLDISRIDAGRLRLVQEPFDLHRTVQLCREILHHRAEEQGNKLVVDVAAGVPHWVLGDSARVLQILLNLAGNALKFTRDGEVRIALRAVKDAVVFTVHDTGIGIPQEKLATIFDRFSQVDVTDQRRYGGAGLGLAIVKELVDLHKGSIEVVSNEGRGTTFTVHLRLSQTEQPANATATHAEGRRSLNGHVILVAEDNEMNALVTTETLRRHYPDCRSVVVKNGQEAIDRIATDEDEDIALVLMDVQMPVMDGMTATRRIRAMNNAQARVPVIALTASVLPSDLSKCLDAGMDACVSKPFKADELLDAIARLTGDRGTPGSIGYDVHDPQVALFHWLVPPRLKALRTAMEQRREEEVKRMAHALRPQLVERDAMFAVLCDRVIQAPAERWSGEADQLATAIQNALQ